MMKKVKLQKKKNCFSEILLVVALIVTCSSCSLMNRSDGNKPPEWYQNQTISSAPNKLVGYGDGATFSEAQTLAKRNITQQIQVVVASKTKIERFQSDEQWRKTFNDIINVRSQVVLGQTPILKKEKQGDVFFVVLEYDNRSLFSKVKDACGKLKALSTIDLKVAGNDYKTALPFFKQLISHGVGIDEFRLQRNNALWYVDICGSSLWIRPDTLFKQFYSEKKNSSCINLRLVPKNRLNNGDKYFIEITAVAKGYLSLFHVTESGQVLELLLNEPVNRNQKSVYPDSAKYEGLLAETGGFDQARDLIIGTLTDEPSEELASFMVVSKKNIGATDERAYSYDQLLEAMQGYCWASKFVYIN